MIWQRWAAHRGTVACRNGGWWLTLRTATARNERWPRSSRVPVVVREPEAGWWRAQAELDGYDEFCER